MKEIARKGGGILNSVKKLRVATSEALKKRGGRLALREFAAYGPPRWRLRAVTGWM